MRDARGNELFLVHEGVETDAKTHMIFTTKLYQIIYADPPWDYGVAGQNPRIGGGAKAHYPTLTIKELCSLPLPAIADNAVLFMWVTSPFLRKDKCWPVIKAWGFEYKSSFVWDKVKHNMGHYVSVRHECLLLCERGSSPPIKKDFPSLYEEPRTVHSRKPTYFREMIDEMYPVVNRIELFARGTLPENWDGWGNEYGGVA